MKILHYSIALLLIVSLGGCGKGNSNAPAAIDPATGKHVVSGWAAPDATTGLPPHATDVTGYYAQPDSCKACHGEDLSGGISKLACYKCHDKPFPHGEGFADFNGSNVSPHASAAKTAIGGQMAGMGYCKKCHGTDYAGRSDAKSCIGCHRLANPASSAPHAGNWVSGNARGLKHSTTDVSNAPACAQCHLGGKYSHPAPSPAPAGTAPQCFNGTMCHNQAGHTFTVADHMVSARSNLASCQTCHATPGTGSNPSFTVEKNATLTPNGCEKCHNRVGIAHPYMWLPGRGGSTTTNHANAQNILASCGLCHGGDPLTGAGTAPSCFGTPINGTSCHSTKPVNAAGNTVGCSSCHGNPPNGVAAPNRAFRHAGHYSTTYGLDGNVIACSACHTGYGSGATTHAARVVFTPMTAPTAIDSKFGEDALGAVATAAYTPNTQRCANVSCHGGKTINFNWKNAVAFNPNNFATCTFNCHFISQVSAATYVAGGSGPYIGPFSGFMPSAPTTSNLHKMHGDSFGAGTNPLFLCGQCHSGIITSKSHWSNIMLGRRNLLLDSPRISASTVSGPKMVSYDPVTRSCVTSGCHLIGIAEPNARVWY